MPLALFLPLLFKKQAGFKNFLITITLIVLGIEFAQFITLSGSCDIDDLILNVSGALIMYGILNIKKVKNLVRNIFLLEKNEVSKKTIIKIILSVLVIIIIMFFLVLYRKNLYNKNYEEAMKYINYDLEVLDDNKNCYGEKEKFYEDEYYMYYFNCTKSDKVYAVINNKEKYLVSDLLNSNPTKYEINIDRLKDAGLVYEKVSKYKELKINIKENVFVNVKNDDETVVNIKLGDNYLEKNNIQVFNFLFIPLKEGSTKLEIELVDMNSEKIVGIKKYDVMVNSSMEVFYEEIK